MSKIEVGKIINVHGLRGTLKVQPWTDYPEKFEEIERVYVDETQFIIENVSYHKQSVLLKLSEIDFVDQAEKMRNKIITAKREDLGPLPEGVYYIVDLIGCTVFENDVEIGVLADVINNGGVDLYEIKRKGMKPLYFPAAKENLVSVDVDAKKIQVKIPEGLLDL